MELQNQKPTLGHRTHPSCSGDEIMDDVNCNNDHGHLLAEGISKEFGGQGVK